MVLKLNSTRWWHALLKMEFGLLLKGLWSPWLCKFEMQKKVQSMNSNWIIYHLWCCSDGAAVNLGHKSGIGKRFQDALLPRHILVQHCAAHRYAYCSKSSFFVQKFNFYFPSKLWIFWVKNSWKAEMSPSVTYL